MLGLIADYTVHVGVIGGYDSGRGVCLLFRETFYEKAGHIVFLWNVYSNGFQALGIAHAVAHLYPERLKLSRLYFIFRNESLNSIMDKLSRWYGLEVLYQDAGLQDVRLSGNLKRYKDVRELFVSFQKISDARFKVQGNKVIVSSK